MEDGANVGAALAAEQPAVIDRRPAAKAAPTKLPFYQRDELDVQQSHRDAPDSPCNHRDRINPTRRGRAQDELQQIKAEKGAPPEQEHERAAPPPDADTLPARAAVHGPCRPEEQLRG